MNAASLKLNIQSINAGHVFSLDEFSKSLLSEVRQIIRQEMQRVCVPFAATEPQREDARETKRALAVSKAEAARILGVSRRTIDYSIALKQIGVSREGRRVLVPIKSLEAAVRRGSLRTGRREQITDEKT